ncbi:MAG: hypothetical protein HQK64_08865 [Desulfamplus sp.]|nr:hypothetical protein [Desulfamplus sp.]
MVAIYLTVITIAMLNITGIGFVIFMIMFEHQSRTQLKRANLKKGSTKIDGIDKNSLAKTKPTATSALPKAASSSKEGSSRGAETAIATGGIVAAATGAQILSNSGNKNGDFDNIDDILDDLDLSDFDDLDLDDFN